MNEKLICKIKFINSTGIKEDVYAEKAGNDNYMLIENPIFFCEINFGTIVNAIANENGELVFKKIEVASQYITTKYLLSSNILESNFKDSIGNSIISIGGYWEAVMGGILFIHWPKECSTDLQDVLNEYNFNAVKIK